MSSAALTSPAPAAVPRFRSQWIISRREDLIWFIGSGLAGYVALGLMALGFPIIPLQFVWFFAIDGPHVLATVTRTYFDRAERGRQGRFLWMPLPLLLIGPAMALAGQAALFLLFAVCWQHFHIVKQHFGFVMLYKAKNRERDKQDLALDRWFLLLSLFVPLGLFVMQTRPALTAAVKLDWLAEAAVGVYLPVAALWVLRQITKWRRGAEMNWPKIALMAAVVPLQWFALLHAAKFGPDGILRAGITLGLFHSLQYHRLMWFHNRNRYSTPEAAERNGFAARLVSNVVKYLAVAIGLNLLLAFLPAALFPYETVQCAIWGLAFMHYCLDARIWRVRGDKELATALRLA